MNLKSAEIMSFLENALLPQVKEKLQFTSDEERTRLVEELASARESATALGVDIATHPPRKIIDFLAQLECRRQTRGAAQWAS